MHEFKPLCFAVVSNIQSLIFLRKTNMNVIHYQKRSSTSVDWLSNCMSQRTKSFHANISKDKLVNEQLPFALIITTLTEKLKEISDRFVTF